MKATSTPLPKRLHVIGICGVATSALAIAFHEKGVIVTGSDKGFFPPVSNELIRKDVPYYAGWHPEKMIEKGIPEIIVIGTASGSHNPETEYAKENNIPTLSFAEAIGRYFVKENSIVCAGTWGKTSSSALLSFIFEEADRNPTYMFGGISLSHESSARLTHSPWSIFEGDEYKSGPNDRNPKFAYYKPSHVLLTAVSWDHADLYPTEKDYFQAFEKLLSSIPKKGFVVACLDEDGVEKIIKNYSDKIVSYGRKWPSPTLDYEYGPVSQNSAGINFTIEIKALSQSPAKSATQKSSFTIHSPMLGLFQAENIAGCFALAHSLGIEPEKIVEAIAKFKGLKRRLEKRLDGKVTIIDDIAHSPEKASVVLSTLQSIYPGRVIAVFEPNTGGRERESLSKYDDAFRDADLVIIPHLTRLKVAEDGEEQPIEGNELAQVIAKTHKNVQYIDDDSKLVDFLMKNKKEDDVIAFLGSHGFRGMIEETVKKLGT
ncbi:MAG: Mur ligase family protein [Candidatus Paceibacterota bacterium]